MRTTKQYGPKRIAPRKRPDPWAEWQARGMTLPDDETLERLSQPAAVASVAGRLVPITTTTEPNEEPKR